MELWLWILGIFAVVAVVMTLVANRRSRAAGPQVGDTSGRRARRETGEFQGPMWGSGGGGDSGGG